MKDVDEMTWPQLAGLFRKMEKFPPVDVIAAAMLEGQRPKPISESIAAFGITPKKGKVKKRGDVSR